MDNKEFIMNIDRQFCEACKTGKEKAWASYFASDGMMITSGNSENIIGPIAIEKAMKSTFSLPSLDFTWEPIECEVSDDFTLAVTRGTSKLQYLKDGELVVRYGNYTTIWKKEHDNWKIAWDIGN